MMDIVIYVLLAIVCIVLLHGHFKCKLPSVPGPCGIPLFGNAFQLDRVASFIQLTKWAKLYGPIYKLNLLGKPVLVVNNYEGLYQLFITKGKDFAGRPHSFSMDYLSENRSDFFASWSPKFQVYKKLLMTHVKTHGSGQKNIENIVCATAAELVEKIKSFNGKPVNIQNIIQDTTTDIIYQLAVGRKGTTEEKSVIANIIHKEESEVLSGSAGGDFYINMFPWLRFFGIPIWKTMKEIKEGQKEQYLRWRDEAITKMETGQSMDQDFLQKFLTVIKAENIHGLTEKHVKSVTWAMFLAGVTTSSVTLMMLINTLLHRSDVKLRLYKEGQQVIGDREVMLSDRKDMPYHQAVILEMLRYSSIIPFSIPHETMRCTELSGHTIPAGIMVWPNLWALHHDEDIWEEPFTFRPERYIDDKGGLVAADHPARRHNLAFAAGPRVCAGELFALSRLFLILAQLVKSFHILPATTLDEQPSCDCRNMVNGLVLFPPQYKVRFLPRKEGNVDEK